MLYIALAAFALGISLQIIFHLSLSFILFLLLCFSAVMFILFPGNRMSGRSKLIIFFLALISLGLVRTYIALPRESIPADQNIGVQVELEGIIVEDPDLRDSSTHYLLEPSSSAFKGYKILLISDRFPEYNYGDNVLINGKVELPEKFDTGQGRSFNYPAYLSKDGIRYIMFRPNIELVEHGSGSTFFSSVYSFKHGFIKNIENALPEPYSSLGNGITLGVKQSLGSEILDNLRVAGIIHIVVLSGYNITIILGGFIYLLSGLRRGAAFTIAALSAILFAALVGFGATVIRAVLMALLALLARALGRPVLALRTLILAGFAMLLWNPLILFYDPSFQLSFLATLGLIVISPIIEKYFTWVTQKWHLREIVVATLATQIFVLPAIIYMTEQFSVLSLPTNILVLPLIPYAMASIGLSGLVGFLPGAVGTALGFIAALPAYLILFITLKISSFVASIPFSSLTITHISLWFVFIAYAMYLIFMCYPYLRRTRTWFFGSSSL